MAENLINSSVGRDRQLVFLNTERIIGVDSIEISSQFGLVPTVYAGIGVDTVSYLPRQEQSASVAISTFIINKDYFFSLTTGNTLTNIYIVKDKTDLSKTYSLVSGYFTNFQCNYSIGNVPKVDATFTAIQNAGQISTGSLPSPCPAQLYTISTSNTDVTGSLLIPYGNSIGIDAFGFNTNRVQSFSINVQSNKLPIYYAGSKFPRRIELIQPIDVEVSLSFEVGDYQAEEIRQASLNGRVNNINIYTQDYSTRQNISTYYFRDLTLLSQNYSATSQNNVLVSHSYATKIYSQ